MPLYSVQATEEYVIYPFKAVSTVKVAITLPEESLSVYSPAATVSLDFAEPLISF